MTQITLPFASEFSPEIIDLVRLLELAAQYGGDRPSFQAAIKQEYFDARTTDDRNKNILAMNVRLGMTAYGLIDRETCSLTDIGKRLYEIREDHGELYKALARHILLHLNGVTLIQCIQDMQSAGEPVTLVSLRAWLAERGVSFPSAGTHPSKMRLWLEKAGVFHSGSSWRINEARLEDVLGIAPQEIEALTQFTPEQRAYLKALANMGVQEDQASYSASDVQKLASATYGIKFNEKSLPTTVLNKLRDSGYITWERGHGGKSSVVTPTEKLDREITLPLLEQAEQQTASDLRPLLRKPLAEILTEIRSADKYIAGLALEALAFKLMRLIDLDYVATRLRGSDTGGAEVDVIFESSRLVFSRWQVQCKNTARVSLDDVAKEVGLTHFLKSNVIVMVTTGDIGPEARRYANKIMQDSNLCIVMINGDDINAIQADLSLIVDVFNREARHAMRLKALSV